MKLNDAQVAAVERQAQAKSLTDDNPAMGQLIEIFGDHTFYADSTGLLVFELVPEHVQGYEPGLYAVVQVAEWGEEGTGSLVPIEPKMLGGVLRLDDDGEDGDGSNGDDADGEDR